MSWKQKRLLADSVSADWMDDLYATALRNGAFGGKLMGAGGGGFMLIFVKPELMVSVREALEDLLYVPFAFENEGSQIIFADDSVRGTL